MTKWSGMEIVAAVVVILSSMALSLLLAGLTINAIFVAVETERPAEVSVSNRPLDSATDR